jgi:excisionase family DNA binding protein
VSDAGYELHRRVLALEAELERHREALRGVIRAIEQTRRSSLPPAADRRIGVSQAAELLGISPDSVRRLILSGRLAAWRLRLTGVQRATVVVREADVLGLLEPVPAAPAAPDEGPAARHGIRGACRHPRIGPTEEASPGGALDARSGTRSRTSPRRRPAARRER